MKLLGSTVLGLGLLFVFAEGVGARMMQIPGAGQASAPAPQAAPSQADATQTPEQAVPITDGPTLFRERGCEHCHEIRGVGGHKGPDLSGVGRRLKANMIEKQIENGGDAMPAFGEALPAEEIAALTKYLERCRAKQPKSKAAGSKS